MCNIMPNKLNSEIAKFQLLVPLTTSVVFNFNYKHTISHPQSVTAYFVSNEMTFIHF